jgi:serine/threonine protein kinase
MFSKPKPTILVRLHFPIPFENMNVSPHCFVAAEMRLIDFGCAKEVNDNEVYKDMAGTPYYISPEVLDPKFQRTGKVCLVLQSWS